MKQRVVERVVKISESSIGNTRRTSMSVDEVYVRVPCSVYIFISDPYSLSPANVRPIAAKQRCGHTQPSKFVWKLVFHPFFDAHTHQACVCAFRHRCCVSRFACVRSAFCFFFFRSLVRSHTKQFRLWLECTLSAGLFTFAHTKNLRTSSVLNSYNLTWQFFFLMLFCFKHKFAQQCNTTLDYKSWLRLSNIIIILTEIAYFTVLMIHTRRWLFGLVNELNLGHNKIRTEIPTNYSKHLNTKNLIQKHDILIKDFSTLFAQALGRNGCNYKTFLGD